MTFPEYVRLLDHALTIALVQLLNWFAWGLVVALVVGIFVYTYGVEGSREERMTLLEVLIVVLLILWLGGFILVPAAGSFIHLLLVIVLILVVIRLIQGRPIG